MRPCPILSVVVPGFNNAHLSAQVIQDIKDTADLASDEWELIFVDDGSTDDTEQRCNISGVHYIKHPENRGVAPAWNTGVKASTGDYVAVLNNDIRIKDGNWMTKLINAVRHATVPGHAIAGPELVNFNSATMFEGRNVPYLNGWCYLFPRRLFAEIGLFDEAFAPASYEDVDLCARAVSVGYELVQVDLRMQHSYSQTVDKYLREKMPGLNARNQAHWLSKMPSLLRPRLTIVFDCPGNMQGGWTPRALEDKGIGGAETAITLLTRELANRGHVVKLFNDVPERSTLEWGNGLRVDHYPRRELPEHLQCDVFVTFRNPSQYLIQSPAGLKLFWSCDQQTSGNYTTDIFPHVTGTVCISDYHAMYLHQRWGLQAERTVVIGCPINHADYEPHADKDPLQFIFCSVPRRGLEYMPTVMREIRAALPDAKLTITSDYRLWGQAHPLNDEFRLMLRGEDFRGMVSREELIKLQNSAMAYPYPCTYEEAFCIAVAECAAAGAIPITTDIGAVAQTVGASGVIVGPPTADFAQRIAKATIELYGKPELMRRAIEDSWRHSVVTVASTWEKLFYSNLPDMPTWTPPEEMPLPLEEPGLGGDKISRRSSL